MVMLVSGTNHITPVFPIRQPQLQHTPPPKPPLLSRRQCIPSCRRFPTLQFPYPLSYYSSNPSTIFASHDSAVPCVSPIPIHEPFPFYNRHSSSDPILATTQSPRSVSNKPSQLRGLFRLAIPPSTSSVTDLSGSGSGSARQQRDRTQRAVSMFKLDESAAWWQTNA